jgi:hypothetical protein
MQCLKGKNIMTSIDNTYEFEVENRFGNIDAYKE